MSKKHLLKNPYKPGDENHLYFNDEKILKFFSRNLGFVEKYFRYSVKELKNIPKKGGALLVANHGFIPFDMILLSKKIFDVTGRRVRVLAHSRSWKIPVLRELALNLGIVDANPENAIKLLKAGELVCVFPGGEKEGLKSSKQKYQLLWEGRYGFIKTALAAKAPIIPCMSIGIDDIFYVFDKPLPFFFGLGGLPIPRKITHYIGKPLKPPSKTDSAAVRKFHARVYIESRNLLNDGLRQRKWYRME